MRAASAEQRNARAGPRLELRKRSCWLYVFDHGLEIGVFADVQFGAGEASLLVVKNSAGSAV